ncbi:expressed unknown protein [Seminavis robusta]|uniref:Uncharacterized protein n=1 Tax=Seminavis robusta TaxID=568900 RepID=A0A9N8H755_9STRA|nr:expressed unknown protein [Seminavis robusta]|eukprot:Sro192_g082520.1 n/a (392) ;mRNA; f:56176-57351
MNHYFLHELGKGVQLEYTLVQDHARTHTSAFQQSDTSIAASSRGRRRRRSYLASSSVVAAATTSNATGSSAGTTTEGAAAAARIPPTDTPLFLPAGIPPPPASSSTTNSTAATASTSTTTSAGPTSRWDSACASRQNDSPRKATTLRTPPSRSYSSCDELSESTSEEAESSESSHIWPDHLPTSSIGSTSNHQTPPQDQHQDLFATVWSMSQSDRSNATGTNSRRGRPCSIQKSQSWPSHFQQYDLLHPLRSSNLQTLALAAPAQGPFLPDASSRQRAGSLPDQALETTLRTMACQEWQKKRASSFPATTAAQMIRGNRALVQRSASLQNWFTAPSCMSSTLGGGGGGVGGAPNDILQSVLNDIDQLAGEGSLPSSSSPSSSSSSVSSKAA